MTLKIEKELYKAIETLIKFPNATVCKHYAALQIIQAMENSGISIEEKLIKSVIDGYESDTKTLSLIKNKI